MVMALHGCQQTNDDVLADWGLVAAAERHGFVLVAPFVTSYTEPRTENCWGFWIDAHPKMGYKSRFRPIETLRNGHWQMEPHIRSGN